MTPRLKPYPAYKDSGVPWLGDIPAHWVIRKQRQVVDMLVSNVDKHSFENEIPVRLCNYVDVYKNDHITERLSFMRATATKDEIERFRLRKGDVIVTKDSESWVDIGVPALVEYTDDELICGYHLAILRPRAEQISGEYLLRATQSQGVASQYFVSANGVTRYGLTHQGIKNIQIPLPPLSEQHAIAAFLDYIDRRVNRYIRARRKLIALLNEQKQAIIHHAVTRGLDPAVPLKPSGVDWLGDIPAHWEVVRIKNLASLKSGDGITAERIEDAGDYPVYGGNGLRGYTNDYTHEGEFVLIGRQGALCGNINYAEGKFWASEHAVVASPVTKFNTLWFGELLRVMNLNQYSISAAQPGLAVERINTLKLPCPPKSEQDTIAKWIILETHEINDAIHRALSQIGLIREYRTRLIADVVTGKLDVGRQGPAWAAALPQELAGEDEEPDMMDAEPDDELDDEQEEPFDAD